MGVDYDHQAAAYRATRAAGVEHMDGWRDAVVRVLQPVPVLPVLDLGSGTGAWSRALAHWLGVRMAAVEPSAGMRAEAVREAQHPLVWLSGGVAAHLPLRDVSCGAAWLSTVIHHVGHLGTAAAELRRVLVPDGRVLIRGAFPGRADRIGLFRWFPEAARAIESFPSVERVVDAFEANGFRFESIEPVAQPGTPPREALALAGTLRKADTTLVTLTDDEFEAGLARLRAADAQPAPDDYLDLLVLG